MMNPYDKARAIEIAAIKDVVPFIRRKCYQGQFVITSKGNLSEFLQKQVGDFLLNCQNGKVWSIELKAELEDRHGNFFLEIWSNAHFGFNGPGWMYTLKSDILLYYFVVSKELYSINFRRLWNWAFNDKSKRSCWSRVHDFPLRPQKKYDQKNDTRGACVPISVIADEVGFNKYDLSSELIAVA